MEKFNIKINNTFLLDVYGNKAIYSLIEGLQQINIFNSYKSKYTVYKLLSIGAK